jgi:hypothetical protein
LLLGLSCGGSTNDDGSAGGQSGSGGGSVLSPRCSQPIRVGDCLASVPAYYHDVESGVCRPFTYGGCGGNENRFASLAECQSACRGGSPELDVCSRASDCLLMLEGCCQCEPTDERHLIAVNRSYQAAVPPSCGPVACEPCVPVDELATTRQYFTAGCAAGQCSVVDIRETDATACREDADCRLRAGGECCEDCDGSGLVSVNSATFLEARGCGSGDEAPICPRCAPTYPPQYVAVCRDAHCRIERTP